MAWRARPTLCSFTLNHLPSWSGRRRGAGGAHPQTRTATTTSARRRRARARAGPTKRRRARECSSFAACQLHLSACQVAAGFDIEGGGADASFRSHFVKGFDSSAASRAQADAAARSRQRVGEREGCGRRRGCNLQVQLRGEGRGVLLAEAGRGGGRKDR